MKIPQIGLGLWQNKDENECKQAVKWALETGYRHFDTAQIYGNEQFLGDVLKASDIPREDVFITTKISVENMGQHLMRSFDKSLENLQTDYVDLLLLHFPVAIKRRSAWHNMQDIYETGRAKAIGVSNYTVKHLEEVLREGKIKPAVNQVELHVFLQQPKLVQYCHDNDILIEAYSPLAHGRKMQHPTLDAIAIKYGKTNAQIMIRWCIDMNTVVLPKSTHRQRIQENFNVFDFALDGDDMKALAELDEDYRTCWDPNHVSPRVGGFLASLYRDIKLWE